MVNENRSLVAQITRSEVAVPDSSVASRASLRRAGVAETPENVLVLNALHHRAFDRHLFTIDRNYRLRVNPTFDPAHPFLRETIVERGGEQVSMPTETRPRPGYFEELNATLAWL